MLATKTFLLAVCLGSGIASARPDRSSHYGLYSNATITTSSSTSSQNITVYPSPVTQISQPTLELPGTTSGGGTTTSIAFVRTERSRTALETPEGSANDQPVTESPRLETSRTDLGSPAPTITPSAIIKTTQVELRPGVTASPQQQPAPAPQGLGGVIASILGVGATVSAVDAINGAGSSPEGSEGDRPGDRPGANGVSGAVVTRSQSAAAAILQTGGSVITIARQSGVSVSVPTEGGSEPAGTNGGSGSALVSATTSALPEQQTTNSAAGIVLPCAGLGAVGLLAVML